MASVRRMPSDVPLEGELIPTTRRQIAYSRVTVPRLPDRPSTEIRPAGWFGLGGNAQDRLHDARVRELQRLGIEVAYAERMAAGVELHGIQAHTEAVRTAEQIVYAEDPESVAGMFAADATGEMVACGRLRHRRYVDVYDAEALNLLQRR
jgi:hypothetical protein